MLLMVLGCTSECDVAGVVTSPRLGALTAVYETLGEEKRVGVRTGTFEVQATCGSPVRVERQDGMLTFVSASQPAETGQLVFVLPAQAAGGFWLGLDRDVVTRVYPGSPAEGKVQLGDRLVALDGVELNGGPVPPALEFESQQLTVERDGVRHTFELNRHFWPDSSPPPPTPHFRARVPKDGCERVAAGEGWAMEAEARWALWMNPWDPDALGRLQATERCPTLVIGEAGNRDTALVERCSRVAPMPPDRSGKLVVAEGVVTQDEMDWPEFRWCLERDLSDDSSFEVRFKSPPTEPVGHAWGSPRPGLEQPLLACVSDASAGDEVVVHVRPDGPSIASTTGAATLEQCLMRYAEALPVDVPSGWEIGVRMKPPSAD